jgi:hypothetical protein
MSNPSTGSTGVVVVDIVSAALSGSARTSSISTPERGGLRLRVPNVSNLSNSRSADTMEGVGLGTAVSAPTPAASADMLLASDGVVEGQGVVESARRVPAVEPCLQMGLSVQSIGNTAGLWSNPPELAATVVSCAKIA